MSISTPSNFKCEKSTVYPGEKMVKVTWTNPPEEITSLTLDIHRENSDEFYRRYGSDPTSGFLYIDIPEDAEIGKYLELELYAERGNNGEDGYAKSGIARTRVKVVAQESENPPPPDTGAWRLEQFQNSEGEDIYPRTVLEGIFRKSDGKSLLEVLEEIETTPGPAGPAGKDGATGATGPAGPGVSAGGSAGQVLAKNSSANYDTQWKTLVSYGTSDLTAGSSSLATGQIHLVYE